MFDIGFFELLLIGVVSLLVMGPERLPGAIRTTSLWLGRLRRSFNAIKADIEKEIGADEIRRQIHNDGILKELEEVTEQAAELIESTTNPDFEQEHAAAHDSQSHNNKNQDPE